MNLPAERKIYKKSKKSKKAQEAAAENDKVAPALQAEIKVELSSAQEAVAEAKGRADQAASDMFQLYANLLSVDAKFTWNKIVHGQTALDTYTDLQGCTKKGPRGLSHKSFDDCMMFHLLTVFPISKQCHSKKHCNLCKKHGGAHTMHNTQDCHRYKKNGNQKSNFQATKKGTRKPNPLCEKMDKLEKVIKETRC